MKIALSEVHHNKKGFEDLVRLHEQTKDCFLDSVEVDMQETRWFDADMCAMLGALLYGLEERLNDVSLPNISPQVEKILSKNGFLSHYGHKKIPDRYGTTISYKRFDVKDETYFFDYIEEEFIRRSEMPEMSPGLLKKFRESIFEIFSNAVSHSRTKLGIFSCGQFFPTRESLDFTVVDLGVGIWENVKQCMGHDLAPEDAIDWATQRDNTTRSGDVPGGLGLTLLSEFIDLNGGCIQIVSDAGYWKRKKGGTTKMALPHRFPGTAVCLEINTADPRSYMLTAELTEHDIF